MALAVNPQLTLEEAGELETILVNRATGPFDKVENARYVELRKKALHPALLSVSPAFLRSCRDLQHFWGFIKQQGDTYQLRKDVIWESLRPLIELLERGVGVPSDERVLLTLEALDTDHVDEMWRKALERRVTDPEAAITAARTLLETVCKLILEDLKIEFPDDVDLPKLYRIVADALTLAPSQHSEPIFKQILGGCHAVVEGLGAVRNRLSDAHGKGKAPARPQSRHAELAVNLAGAMSIFLVDTWQARKPEAADYSQ